ncbi:MAG: DUF3489 domain-containing protein [Burkholderiaceae bacterium]
MTIQLTPAQHAILAYAHQHTEGKINWFPDHIKGGARQKVIDSLLKRALITPSGSDWFVAAEGYEALGVPRKSAVSSQAIDEVIQATTATNPRTSQDRQRGQVPNLSQTITPRTRENSKQAQVIAMLKRAEGATITQICEVTQWQSHTVRGTFAGAFKKKLGLAITSTKDAGSERIYRVAV